MMETAPIDLSEILARLTRNSRRPRYAMLVLSLLSEAADGKGQAGPFVHANGELQPIRLWLGGTLARMSAHHTRRAAMRERVRCELGSGPRDDQDTSTLVEQEVEQRARTAGGANISRAVTDLVNCGLVRREYVGHWTRHPRKGGQRHAAYVVSPDALAALRRGSQLL